MAQYVQVSTTKDKIGGIETGATGDQTAAEIKTAYESNADTNGFTDAEQTKLAGVEAAATADQTAAEIKTAYESNADTNGFTDTNSTNLGLCVTHKDQSDNPHSVTKTQVGLANVTNEAQIPLTQKAAANGVASLDGSGKIPTAQLNLDAMEYKGAWNASTNSPALGDSGSGGTKGDFYKVGTSGSTSVDGETDWVAGDCIVHNGSTWDKIDATDAVTSVAGYTGVVTLDTDDVSEGSNLYYTEARVNANTNVAANTSAKHTHANSGVLDATTASFLTADETKLDNLGATVNGTAQTTGTSAVTAVTYTPADGEACMVEVKVVGRKADGTQVGVYTLRVGARRSGSTTTKVGTEVVAVIGEDDGTWVGPTAAVSGADLLLQVAGKATTNIDWRVQGVATALTAL